jgi:hypothetical protein
MHCDRVYAILTRGPFPSGEVTDVAVEIHLAHCLECRRLAEALRPLDPAREPASTEEARLPGYRGDHPEWRPHGVSSVKTAQAARRQSRIVPAPFRRLSPRSAGRFIIVMLLGVAIGVVCSAVGFSNSSRERSGIAGASFVGRPVDGWREARVQAQLIYGLDLPRACSTIDLDLFSPLSADERSPAQLTHSPPSLVNQCCTQCHVVGGRTHIGHSQRGILIESCTICHGDSPRSAR